MLERVMHSPGFVAALDQSGGSTPSALEKYGIPKESISSHEEMYACVHAMRARLISSEPFNSRHVIGAILFKDTLNRNIEGIASAEYLWKSKGIVPFLKVDDGLMPESDGVQLMNPIKEFTSTLRMANSKTIFGTKMRSVIKSANELGIRSLVKQQFDVAGEIIKSDLVPIIEPEVDIHCPDKKYAEYILKDAIREELDNLDEGQRIILKLTLPDESNIYHEFSSHPNVLRILALSGGYLLTQANQKLERNSEMIASFSRALLGGLHYGMSKEEFDRELNCTIEVIYNASVHKK
jgi:fructose-bisphosphate aldolase class I|tara:strand:- start:11144 stop:12025 length:882 start_codon:yes stop_codon:yes gene_type:complete